MSTVPPGCRTRPAVVDEVVLGVDTHWDVHVAAVLSMLGAVMDSAPSPATAGGYRELWKWASRLGTVCRAGVEGSGSYGAALSRYLLACRVEVFEVNRPDRSVRRRRGASDPVDAQEAARAVLSGRARSQAKAGDGPVQCARLFKLAKDSAVKARTQAINQLEAVLTTADPDLREQLAGLKNPALVRTCAQFEDHESGDGARGAVEQAASPPPRPRRRSTSQCRPGLGDRGAARAGFHLVGSDSQAAS